MSVKKDLIKKFKESISQDTKLSNYSWFNLGGPAEFFFKPKDKKELIDFLVENKKINFEITVIGAGSNILIRDNGIKGVVIKLSKGFSDISVIDDNILEVGASVLDRKVADFAKNNEIGGLEFLSCIPGSIGGAIIMNSGCYENEISKVLESISVIDIKNCMEKKIKKEEIEFFYRGTSLSKNFIIISARLKGKKNTKDLIEQKQIELIEKKKLSQPSQVKTCGSTFKNIDKHKKAWMLIKETGCHTFKEGDAQISQKHCNFFVNNGKANSRDIEKLIDRVQNTVSEKTGVNLELEIKIIGEK